MVNGGRESRLVLRYLNVVITEGILLSVITACRNGKGVASPDNNVRGSLEFVVQV
jgi:hypothetical protein